MTIIFDLDYTLLDTARFKKDLFSALEECGISEAGFQKVYSVNVEKDALIRDFDMSKAIRELRDSLSCSEEEAARRVETVVKNTHTYLFQDAKEVLDALKSDGHHLALLTHGNVEWQKKKVEYSGVAEDFGKVFYAPGKKEEMKDAFADMKLPVVMVNDNGKEIDALVAVLPKYKMIAVRGPKPLPTDTEIPICDNLKEVYSEIKKLV